MDTSGYKRTGSFQVKTALVETSGRPKELSHTDFKEYEEWYDKVSDDQREKWGDSESFSYKHSDNSFYTAMKKHEVHFGGGFDFGRFISFRNPHKDSRDLELADSAYKIKREPNSNMSDQDKINLFSPYARAHGEGFSEQGNSLNDGHKCTVPSVTVDTTQPR